MFEFRKTDAQERQRTGSDKETEGGDGVGRAIAVLALGEPFFLKVDDLTRKSRLKQDQGRQRGECQENDRDHDAGQEPVPWHGSDDFARLPVDQEGIRCAVLVNGDKPGGKKGRRRERCISIPGSKSFPIVGLTPTFVIEIWGTLST